MSGSASFQRALAGRFRHSECAAEGDEPVPQLQGIGFSKRSVLGREGRPAVTGPENADSTASRPCLDLCEGK